MEGTYGAEMIGKLKQMDVLIIGLQGLGIETAKNLVLAGPHSVTVHDDAPVAIADLGTNFYFSEKDVGKGRASACIKDIAELNPNTNVNQHSGEITEGDLSKYNPLL